MLPHVENGTVTLIGATTENPSFEVNAALLSRVRVFTLHALGDADIELSCAARWPMPSAAWAHAGSKSRTPRSRHLVERANGDARMALNALELAADAAR